MASFNRVVNKGVCKDDSKGCEKQQLRYIDACEKLGDYYYGLRKYKTALKYYLLPSYLDTYTDGELQRDEPIKLRNKVAAKAGDMYVKGLGSEKNLQKAFNLYYLLPGFLTDSIKSQYSRLIFGNNKSFYTSLKSNILIDTVSSFGINPFYLTNMKTAMGLNVKLRNIEQRMITDSSLRCTITINYGMLNLSELNQGYLNRFLDNIKKQVKENFLKEKFSFEVIINNEGYNYKFFSLPKLNIIVR